jgi:hypothetical protein
MHFHNAGFLASLPNTPNRKAKNNARNQSLHDELQDAGVQKVIDIRLNTAS